MSDGLTVRDVIEACGSVDAALELEQRALRADPQRASTINVRAAVRADYFSWLLEQRERELAQQQLRNRGDAGEPSARWRAALERERSAVVARASALRARAEARREQQLLRQSGHAREAPRKPTFIALRVGGRAAYATALRAWQLRAHSLALRGEQLQRLCEKLREYANDGPLAQLQVAALAHHNVARRNRELEREVAEQRKDCTLQAQTTRQTQRRRRSR
jgi:hypothetical protein